jgi:hypothetical protein
MKTYSVDILGVKSSINNGFVFEVSWTAYIVYDGFSKDEGYYTVYKTSSSKFVDDGNSFIPFDDLEKETVEEWVTSSPEYLEVISILEVELETVMQPSTFSEELPW